MNSWVRIGAKCVCVDATWEAPSDPPIAKGAVYTIKWTGESYSDYGKYVGPCLFIALMEKDNPFSPDGGFAVGRFRPLIPIADDISLFTEIAKLSKLDQLATTMDELA